MTFSSRAQGGLTLLEVLVVLTLISLISGVLFQGYGYMMGNYQRIRERQNLELRTALVSHWWRSSIATLVAYYEDDLRFTGDRRGLRGASFMPLLSDPGRAREVRWSLENTRGTATLMYEQPPASPIAIKTWENVADASFQYLNDADEWAEFWSTEGVRQLPRAVRIVLRGEPADQVATLTAQVHARRNQHIPNSVILYGHE
ncbi:MAG: prepilin-type N-terminal cleavage/methylation domain-containing protein [Pseudomonadota bacterium]